MRVLLTGASGYLGQHLIVALSRHREDIELCCLHGGSNQDFSTVLAKDYPKATNVSLDISNDQEVSQWFHDQEKFDVCIHTAALSSPRICEADADRAQAINCPKRFLDCLKETLMIVLSTDQVYDGNHAPYVEDDDQKPNPCNVYGKTKLDLENYILSNHKQCVSLRSSIILGPKAPLCKAHDTFLHFCASRENQSTDFYKDQIRSVVAVSDVTATILHMMDRRHSETPQRVFNMGGPDPQSRVDIAMAVFDHFGYNRSAIVAKPQPMEGPVPMPRDISMDSSQLYKVMGRTFLNLEAIIQATFES